MDIPSCSSQGRCLQARGGSGTADSGAGFAAALVGCRRGSWCRWQVGDAQGPTHHSTAFAMWCHLSCAASWTGGHDAGQEGALLDAAATLPALSRRGISPTRTYGVRASATARLWSTGPFPASAAAPIAHRPHAIYDRLRHRVTSWGLSFGVGVRQSGIMCPKGVTHDSMGIHSHVEGPPGWAARHEAGDAAVPTRSRWRRPGAHLPRP